MRATKDVDIMPEPSDANLRRLWPALQELDAAPLALQHLRPEGLPEAFALGGRSGTGICRRSTGDSTSSRTSEGSSRARRATPLSTGGRKKTRLDFGVVRFVGYGDLLDMKTLAGRDQDLVDIRALREARGDIGLT